MLRSGASHLQEQARLRQGNPTTSVGIRPSGGGSLASGRWSIQAQKRLPGVPIQAQEIQVEIAAIVQKEIPVEVPQVQTVATITQAHVRVCEVSKKTVPPIYMQFIGTAVQWALIYRPFSVL